MSEYREDILSNHARMKEVRAVEEPHWREIAAFLRSDDRDFDARVQRRRDDSPIFTIEPILAVEDFEGGFFSQASNPMNRWGELSSGDDDLDKFQPVKAWLWRRTNQVLASFTPGVSPFYTEVPDWYGQICCFGWSGFYCEEVVGAGMFSDRAIPINESYIERDATQRVVRFHREFSLTGRQAKAKAEFRGAAGVDKIRDDDRRVFVHAVFPNAEYRPGVLGPIGMPWMAGYVSPNERDFFVPGAYYDFPYACPGWRRRSGRPYPTGIGHTIRAEVVMINEMARSNMVAGQFAAEPPVLVDEKSTVLAADIEPNAILYGTMNADGGKKKIDTLDRHQNLPFSLEMQKNSAETIRKAVRFGLTQLLQRPEMTATEFLGFQEEDLKLMGPGLVKVQNDGLAQIFARRYFMMDRAGLFDADPPPPELIGKTLTIKFTSPLSQMLKVSEAKGAVQWMNAMLPIAQVRPEVMDNADLDAWAIVVHDGFTSDPTLLMDPRKRDAMRAQRAAQQQAMQKMQMAENAANIHATVSHANQAQTLATARK